jgi:hypothetical protein
MRKTILICFILYFVSNGAVNNLYAQIGFKMGMSNSSLSISENEGRPFFGYEIDWLIRHELLGVQLGVFKDFEISKHFGIQTEIFYVRRGMNASTHFLFDDIDYKIKLDYIEIPTEFKLKLPLTKSITTGLMAGPYFAIKLGAKRHSQIDGITKCIKLKNVHNFDYGFIVSLYSDNVIRKLNFVLELRYNHGLSNIMDQLENSVRVSEEGGTIKSKSVIILMGVCL